MTRSSLSDKLIFLLAGIALAALVVFGLYAFGFLGGNADAPENQPTPAATHSEKEGAAGFTDSGGDWPEPSETPSVDSTFIAKRVWGGTIESEKDALCFGAEAGGHDYITSLLRKDDDGSSGIDWDEVATFIEQQCEKENR